TVTAPGIDHFSQWAIAVVDGAELVGVESPAGLPTAFALHDAYPNPFNPSTTIAFDVAASADVTLSIYNSLGQRVAVLVDGAYGAGRDSVTFSGDGLPSGVYLYVVEMGDFKARKTMVLVK